MPDSLDRIHKGEDLIATIREIGGDLETLAKTLGALLMDSEKSPIVLRAIRALSDLIATLQALVKET